MQECDAILMQDPRYLKDDDPHKNKISKAKTTKRCGVHVYKNAAMKAPKPTMLPAAALTLTAAPVEAPLAPVPVREASAPEPEASAPLPDAPLPVASASELVGVATIATVVLLLALTVTVRVELTMEPVPVPARVRVWTPGPTAGMSAGAG